MKTTVMSNFGIQPRALRAAADTGRQLDEAVWTDRLTLKEAQRTERAIAELFSKCVGAFPSRSFRSHGRHPVREHAAYVRGSFRP